jgi:hypothetical protein
VRRRAQALGLEPEEPELVIRMRCKPTTTKSEVGKESEHTLIHKNSSRHQIHDWKTSGDGCRELSTPESQEWGEASTTRTASEVPWTIQFESSINISFLLALILIVQMTYSNSKIKQHCISKIITTP